MLAEIHNNILKYAQRVDVSQPVDVDHTFPDRTEFQERGVQRLRFHKPLSAADVRALIATGVMIGSAAACIFSTDIPVAHAISLGTMAGSAIWSMAEMTNVAHQTRQFVDEKMEALFLHKRRIRSTLEIQMEHDLRVGRRGPGCFI